MTVLISKYINSVNGDNPVSVRRVVLKPTQLGIVNDLKNVRGEYINSIKDSGTGLDLESLNDILHLESKFLVR